MHFTELASVQLVSICVRRADLDTNMLSHMESLPQGKLPQKIKEREIFLCLYKSAKNVEIN